MKTDRKEEILKKCSVVFDINKARSMRYCVVNAANALRAMDEYAKEYHKAELEKVRKFDICNECGGKMKPISANRMECSKCWNVWNNI